MIASFNILADPYEVWHVYDKVGFNRYAVKGEALERMMKPLSLLQQKPQTVFFGTSISNLGLDPSYYEELTGKHAYNMAVDSGRIYEIRRYIEYAAQVDPNFDEAVVELNITMFYADAEDQAGGTKENGFDEHQLNSRSMRPETFAKLALSFDACRDSWDNLLLNYRERPAYRAHETDGQISEGQKEKLYGSNDFYKFLELNIRNMSQIQHKALSEKKMSELKKIMDFCSTHGIQLHLYVPLMSAAANSGIDSAIGDVYDEWLRELAKLDCVYVFAQYDGVMAGASSTGKSWFWDSNHMRTALGNKVLECLTGQQSDLQATLLQTTMVEDYLQQQKKERDAWKVSYPQIWQHVRFLGRFIPERPEDVKEKTFVSGQSIVHFDDVMGKSWQGQKSINLSRKQTFKLSGWSLSCRGECKAVYAVFEDDQGQWYVTQGQITARPDVSGLMADPAGLNCGLTLDSAVDLMPDGQYKLRIMEIAADDKVYLSEILTTVELGD
jgi:hypothetical protein